MKKKSSITSKLRNAFIAGIVVLIPIGFTLYLTLFLIKISSKLIPNEINPNNYLPFSIPGLEILLSVIFITIVLGISSFFGNFRIPAIIGSIDLLFMLFVTVMILGFMFFLKRIGRIYGITSLILYFSYIFYIYN